MSASEQTIASLFSRVDKVEVFFHPIYRCYVLRDPTTDLFYYPFTELHLQNVSYHSHNSSDDPNKSALWVSGKPVVALPPEENKETANHRTDSKVVDWQVVGDDFGWTVRIGAKRHDLLASAFLSLRLMRGADGVVPLALAYGGTEVYNNPIAGPNT